MEASSSKKKQESLKSSSGDGHGTDGVTLKLANMAVQESCNTNSTSSSSSSSCNLQTSANQRGGGGSSKDEYIPSQYGSYQRSQSVCTLSNSYACTTSSYTIDSINKSP